MYDYSFNRNRRLMETQIKKTPYEWCLEANIRVLDLNEWPENFHGSPERCFFEFEYTSEEFLGCLNKCKVKPNSQPRKTEMYLEYRMYGLVPYNISDKQKGIQFGHAVVRYGRTLRKDPALSHMLDIYDKYADRDETFIILDGGTTNKSTTYVGTMNKHLQTLRDAGILVQDFYEPDLGDQLSAMCFLVDERAFNRVLYPDFLPEALPWSRSKPNQKTLDDLEARNAENYKHWVEKIGGEKNAFLREFLKPLRLA